MTPQQKTIQDCTEQALRYLSMRDHNKAELSAKLRLKNYGPEVIDAVITALEEDGSQSESRYVQSFVRSSNRKHPEGKSVLLQRLLQKGTDRTVAMNVLNEMYTPEYTSLLMSQAQERMRRKCTDEDRIRLQLAKLGFRTSSRD